MIYRNIGWRIKMEGLLPISILIVRVPILKIVVCWLLPRSGLVSMKTQLDSACVQYLIFVQLCSYYPPLLWDNF